MADAAFIADAGHDALDEREPFTVLPELMQRKGERGRGFGESGVVIDGVEHVDQMRHAIARVDAHLGESQLQRHEHTVRFRGRLSKSASEVKNRCVRRPERQRFARGVAKGWHESRVAARADCEQVRCDKRRRGALCEEQVGRASVRALALRSIEGVVDGAANERVRVCEPLAAAQDIDPLKRPHRSRRIIATNVGELGDLTELGAVTENCERLHDCVG